MHNVESNLQLALLASFLLLVVVPYFGFKQVDVDDFLLVMEYYIFHGL